MSKLCGRHVTTVQKLIYYNYKFCIVERALHTFILLIHGWPGAITVSIEYRWLKVGAWSYCQALKEKPGQSSFGHASPGDYRTALGSACLCPRFS